MSLFQEWLLKKQTRNKELPGPPGPRVSSPMAVSDLPSPPAEQASARAIAGDFILACITDDAPQWQVPLDPLYTGKLCGIVPENWSREGWLASVRDRMARTNDPVVLAMLRAELDAIEGFVRSSRNKR